MVQSPVRILLADDEELFVEATADLLRSEGYLCDYAWDAAEASTALETQSYDLLIIDINMPGNQSLELLRATRPSEHGIPVIIVTGYPSLPTALASLHLAVSDYLIKPLEFSELVHSIEQALEKRRILKHIDENHMQAKEWCANIERLVESMVAMPARDRSGEEGFSWMLGSYLGQTVSHIAQLTVNLMQTLHAMMQQCAVPPTDVCLLLRCPRLAAYKAGLYDAVKVIEKTKQAFKSKDLADLRKRLETLLQEATVPEPQVDVHEAKPPSD